MEKERLIIKNFGPIVEADIEIKPFMVFIGESGSGKSVILKLLSLFRWIYKKLALKDLSKSAGITKEPYRFRIERMLKESGLEDFCIKGSEAHYYMGDFCVSITRNGKLSLKYPKQTFNKITLEKISFITDDRFAIPLLVNNQIRGVSPYHLEKTFEDFEESFEHLQTNRKAKAKVFDIELSLEKYGIQYRFFLNFKDSKTQLHNASSGMKSASIIELIATYFATDKEYMQNKYTDFVIDIFSRFKTRDTNIFLENLKNVKINKERFSLFIEEPELSLFPSAQKRLIEYLVDLCFYLNPKKTIQVAFSTHSPYILSTLNCLLLAHQVGNKTRVVESIIPSEFWLDIKNFNAFKIKNGEVTSIIDEKTSLILADEIDEVSEEIGEMFDKLLDLE
ncbi:MULTISPECIES: AAA family ATPase [Helicobacter]|uniref:AAA family ATPase n=2 Tax=Helicobacteraceae TaxID=72293 RepID=UPI00261ABCF1|nr:AAA family ATPase [Helicobacter sp. UBA3407]